MTSPKHQVFPEVGAGGYTSRDGSIEFYTRINALINPGAYLLDFGAGRGSWDTPETPAWVRDLRRFHAAGRIVACDIDLAVGSNPAPEAVVTHPDGQLPFREHAFDIIVADFVFEHLKDPSTTAVELDRVLSPGGWLCARTTNRHSLPALAARLIPNSKHVRVLSKVQPGRCADDVFPTEFKANSMKEIRRLFPTDRFKHYSYFYEPEPAYYFGRATLLRLLERISKMLPNQFKSNIFVFLEKLPPSHSISTPGRGPTGTQG